MGNTDAQLNPPSYKSRQQHGNNNFNQFDQNAYGSYNNNNNNQQPYHQQNMYQNKPLSNNSGQFSPKPNTGTTTTMSSNGVYEEKHIEQNSGGNQNQIQLSPQEMMAMEIFNSEAMNVSWVFWKDNVDILPRNKQKELALLLYCHMFQKIPTARRLFIKGEIDEQALKFLDMFGYLIRQLKDYDSQNTLLKTLQSLGKRHKDWGVRFQYFEPMLNSLHSSLSDHFKHTYTVRVKFCMEQIFTSAANIMTGQDLSKIFKKRYAGMGNLSFLNSLEDCLADPTGKEYLDRFLVQSFCAELVAFEKAYKDYKGSLSDIERYISAQKIVKQFLTSNAKNELNIKNLDIKHKVLKKIDKIQKNKGTSNKKKSEYPPELFDDIHQWVLKQILNNSWPKFKNIITSISISKPSTNYL